MQKYPLHTPKILKNLLQSKNFVCDAVTWTKITLAIFQLWFHYFSAFSFKALGIHFLQSPFLYMEMITSVCQSFEVFRSFYAIWHTFVNQHTSSFNAFNTWVQIASSLAFFLDFNSCTAAATSVKMKIYSFPKSIKSHVSMGVALPGFNKFSKYSLNRGRISFHPLGYSKLNPWWRLWYLNFSHANSKWSAKIHCLPMNSWNTSDNQTPPKSVLWTFLLPELQLFMPWNIRIANQMITYFVTKL